jgi:hypothetical protein
MPAFGLFDWWAISISGGSVFLTLVSIYLYASSRPKRSETNKKKANKFGLGKDFVFVWVLLGLLVFYIISIKIGSVGIFAAGNIFVEALLVVYLMRNRTEKPKQT